MMDIERENHQRFIRVIEYTESVVRKRFQEKWKSDFNGDDWIDDVASQTKLLKRLEGVNALTKDGTKSIKSKPLNEWDLTLLLLISQEFKTIGKKFLSILRDGRNAIAHAAGGRLRTDDFEKHFNSFCNVLEQEFQCDRKEIMKLKTVSLEDDTTIGMKDEAESIDAAKKCKEEGNRFFSKSEFGNAEKEYTKDITFRGCITSNRRLIAELYLNRSQARLKQGKSMEALDDAQEASQIQDSWYKPFYRLGEMYQKSNQYRKASHNYEIALNLIPDNEDGLRSSIKEALSECRHHHDIESRQENFNLQYNPTASTFGAGGKAILASQGLGSNETPMNAEKLLNMFPTGAIPPHLKWYLDAEDYKSKGNFDMALKKYNEGAIVYKDPDAMYNLSIFYLNGMGCLKDLNKSHSWLLKATKCPEPNRNDKYRCMKWKLGVSHAYNGLGLNYKLGICVDKSLEKSIECFKIGADLGCSSAQNNMGIHYLKDYALNIPLAKDYFRLAVENELPANEAMSNMADIYMRIPNIDAAIRWSQTAINYGLTTAEESLNQLKSLKKSPMGSLESLPPEFRTSISTLFQLAQKDTTPNTRARSVELSDLLKIPNPSPFAQNLIEAKRKFDEIQSILTSGKDFESLKQAIFHCASVYRNYPDALLVANFEARNLFELFKLMEKHIGTIDDEYKKNLQLLEAILGGDYDKHIIVLQRLSLTNPNDAYIAELYGSLLMFDTKHGNKEQGIVKLTQALSLYGKTLDDSSPQMISMLYSIGAAHAICDNRSIETLRSNHNSDFTASENSNLHYQLAKSFLERYLKVAVPFGHRKLPEAYFTLAMLLLHENGDIEKIKELFSNGTKEKQKIPEVIQDPNDSPREQMLLSLFPEIVDKTNSPQNLDNQIFGGQGLGNRACKLLLCDKPHYLHVKRKERVETIAFVEKNKNMSSFKSTKKLHPEIGKVNQNIEGKHSEIFVEEMISYRKDQAFSGRVLKCVIVTPIEQLVASNVVVEDEMRDSINVAIYNASDTFLKKLVVGTVMEIRDPHLRISNDYLFLIRVENPNERIKFTDQHISLCWGCIKITQKLNYCSRCKQAKYCSKECQDDDWKQYGHQYLCKSLKQ